MATTRRKRPAKRGLPAAGKNFRIEWQGLDEAPTIFSNNFLVQTTGEEFFITFCQLVPPLLLPTADVSKVDTVTSKATVRIAMPPARLQEFVVLLTGQLNNYLASLESAIQREEKISKSRRKLSRRRQSRRVCARWRHSGRCSQPINGSRRFAQCCHSAAKRQRTYTLSGPALPPRTSRWVPPGMAAARPNSITRQRS